MKKALWQKDVPAEVYVGMRYWHPFTEEAIEQVYISFYVYEIRCFLKRLLVSTVSVVAKYVAACSLGNSSNCRQAFVAHSSTKLEYRTLPDTLAELIQLQFLVLEIGFSSSNPPIIFFFEKKTISFNNIMKWDKSSEYSI